MDVCMDDDVKKVIEFMSRNMSASKLVSVPKAVNDLALPLWGHHQSESIVSIALRNVSISLCDQHRRSIPSE